MLGEPARAHGRQHAHCRQGFRLAQVGRGLLGGEDRQLPGLGQRFARAAFVDPGEQHQQQRPNQGEQAEPGTEEEDHQQVEREPGRVEEGEQGVAGEELAQAGQVVQRLPDGLLAALQAGAERGVVDALVELHVELAAEADHHQAAHPLQGAEQQVEAEHHEGQHQQGHVVAGAEHPVVDLQHVQRRRQHQQVDHRGEQRDAAQRRAEAAEGGEDFIARRGRPELHRSRVLWVSGPRAGPEDIAAVSTCRARPAEEQSGGRRRHGCEAQRRRFVRRRGAPTPLRPLAQAVHERYRGQLLRPPGPGRAAVPARRPRRFPPLPQPGWHGRRRPRPTGRRWS